MKPLWAQAPGLVASLAPLGVEAIRVDKDKASLAGMALSHAASRPDSLSSAHIQNNLPSTGSSGFASRAFPSSVCLALSADSR